jgi:transcriptional regulator with XRE-family HTH domain
MNFGESIRELRKAKGVTIANFAKEMGVSSVYITQIEKHSTLPSVSLVVKMEKFLEEDLRDTYINQKVNEMKEAFSKESGMMGKPLVEVFKDQEEVDEPTIAPIEKERVVEPIDNEEENTSEEV